MHNVKVIKELGYALFLYNSVIQSLLILARANYEIITPANE